MRPTKITIIPAILLFLGILFILTELAAAAPGDRCGRGRIYDCQNQCVRRSTVNDWRGDGLCDDGTWGIYLNCEEFNYDDGDCSSDLDCNGDPFNTNILGNSICNSNLNCAEWSFDEGDCIETCDGDYISLIDYDGYLTNGVCNNGSPAPDLDCAEHNYDGWECSHNDLEDCNGDQISTTEIANLLSNGTCDPRLFCADYGYDNGDCSSYNCYPDDDLDGYGDSDNGGFPLPGPTGCGTGYVNNNDDCDDTNPDIYPGADDIVCDGIDNDCDGEIDEDAPVTLTVYRDNDGDGYGNSGQSVDVSCNDVPDGYVEDDTDCNDYAGDIHPGALEICEDTIDQDCDGSDPVCPVAPPNVCQDLSNSPLEANMESPPPIVMLLMDDTGSMLADMLVPEKGGVMFGENGYDWYQDRFAGWVQAWYYHSFFHNFERYWQSQWAGYNGLYYDPEVDYVAWPDSTTNYSDASRDYPRLHPNQSGTRTMNATFLNRDGVDIRWSHYYTRDSAGTPYLVNITGSGGSYNIYYYEITDCDGGNNTCGDPDSYIDTLAYRSSPPSEVQTSRSAAEERQNFVNWFQYHRTRQLAAIGAIAQAVDQAYDMKIGLHTINQNNSVNLIDPRLVNDYKENILYDLYRVGANSGTALRSALKEVGEYLADGTNGPYSSSQDGGACQQAYTILMTDGYWNGSTPFGIGNRDGDGGTGDNNTIYDGGEFGDAYSDTLADVSMYYYERDLHTSLEDIVPTNPRDPASHQHMVTYAISFGLPGQYDPEDYPTCGLGGTCPPWPYVDRYSENRQNITDLWHASVNGRGKFLQANNTTQLTEGIQELIEDVGSREGAGASIAVTSHQLKQGTHMYQGTYNSSGWYGDLQAYAIDIDGDVSTTPSWSARSLLDARSHTGRRIYTMGENGVGEPDGFPFNTANISNLSSEQQYFLGSNTATRERLVNFIRGDRSNEDNYGGVLRDRVSVLGDIINSEPQYINDYLYVGANDGMLHVFDANTGQELWAYIPSFVYHNLSELADPDYTHQYFVNLSPFIGYRNDQPSGVMLIGGLGRGGKGYFALDIDIEDPSTFDENDVRWEFPDKHTALTHIDYMGYSFSDSAIVKTEGRTDRVVFFGNGYDSTEGKAALFVLDPDTGDVLHMIDTGYGSPLPADNNCNGLSTPVFIDVNNNGKADYAYAGDLRGNIWKFDIRDADPTKWEVAYRDSSDNPQPLFQARDADGNPQPIVTRLAIKKHCNDELAGYMVMFGTGRFNSDADLTDTSPQAVYGIWDWAAEWQEEYEDQGESETSASSLASQLYLGSFNLPSSSNLSNLVANTQLASLGSNRSNLTLLSQSQNGSFFNYGGDNWAEVSANEIEYFSVARYLDDPTDYGDDDGEGFHLGWYFVLPLAGERVVADPVLWLDYLLIVSQHPSDVVCEVGGDSYLSAFNFCSGAGPQSPFFDINNDDKVSGEDIYDNGTPSDEDDDVIPGRKKLDDFTTYAGVKVGDELYFGPEDGQTIQDLEAGVLYWKYINTP